MFVNITKDTGGNLRVEVCTDADRPDEVVVCLSKEVADIAAVLCLNSGIPGVIGPDVDFTIKEALAPILDAASEGAYK